MARGNLRLDVPGLVELRNSPGVLKVIGKAADDVALSASGAPEVMRHRMRVKASKAKPGTRRGSAIVTILHPGGLGVQGKHGTLTRAVTAAGLPRTKVRRRP